jgi:hypothetical protein
MRGAEPVIEVPPTWRDLARALSQALTEIVPVGITLVPSGSRIEVDESGSSSAIELDLDEIGSDVDIRSMPPEDVVRCLYSALSNLQDVCSRQAREPWPAGGEPSAEVTDTGANVGYGAAWTESLRWVPAPGSG